MHTIPYNHKHAINAYCGMKRTPCHQHTTREVSQHFHLILLPSPEFVVLKTNKQKKNQTYRTPKEKKEDTVEVFPAMVFGNSAVALYPVPLLFFHLVLVSRMPSSREAQHSVSFVFIQRERPLYFT